MQHEEILDLLTDANDSKFFERKHCQWLFKSQL